MIREIVLTLAAGSILSGCGSSEVAVNKESVQGVIITVRVESAGDSKRASQLAQTGIDAIEKRLELLKDNNGALAKLNRERALAQPPEDLVRLLEGAERLQRETGMAFDHRYGEVRRLWALDSKRPGMPDATQLEGALQRARATRIEVSRERIGIEGQGLVDPGLYGLGWAADGGFEAIAAMGSSDGTIVVGPLHLAWGRAADSARWNHTFADPREPDLQYTLTPEAGALALLHPAANGMVIADSLYLRLVSPRNGQPSGEIWTLAVWCRSAAEAGGLVEAFITMGRRGATEWLMHHPGIGFFVISGSSEEYAAEADPVMGQWLTSRMK
ncbi:MAG: hypothetical protein FJY67_00625 [Calditrichaeota bacterium]|nr:hypothetical protein [Calditrichota bacterium]